MPADPLQTIMSRRPCRCDRRGLEVYQNWARCACWVRAFGPSWRGSVLARVPSGGATTGRRARRSVVPVARRADRGSDPSCRCMRTTDAAACVSLPTSAAPSVVMLLSGWCHFTASSGALSRCLRCSVSDWLSESVSTYVNFSQRRRWRRTVAWVLKKVTGDSAAMVLPRAARG